MTRKPLSRAFCARDLPKPVEHPVIRITGDSDDMSELVVVVVEQDVIIDFAFHLWCNFKLSEIRARAHICLSNNNRSL